MTHDFTAPLFIKIKDIALNRIYWKEIKFKMILKHCEKMLICIACNRVMNR